MGALAGPLRLLLGACLLAHVWAENFLIVTQPLAAKVVYFQIPGGAPKPSFKQTPTLLINENLQKPTGMAWDAKLNKLFICDEGAGNIFAYTIVLSDGKLVVDGAPKTVGSDVKASWVAVNGIGDVYFSSGEKNLIQKLYAERMVLDDNEPETLYDGTRLDSAVSKPSGIAVDNFHVFWGNRALGTQVGSLMQGFESPPDKEVSPVNKLSDNSLKTFGVCLSTTNVFYTGAENNVYGIKKSGGPVATITDKLIQPRGCVWDGDGTIYVADKGAGAIYTFPGQQHDPQAVVITKAFNVPEPFGLEFISVAESGGAAGGSRSAVTLLGALLALSLSRAR